MAARPSLPPPRILTLRRAAVTALFAAAILGGALLGVFFAFESDLPQVTSLEDYQPNIITQVFSADGSVLGEFAIEKRVVVAFPDIPPVLRNAIVSVEDADFWKHIGVNVWRVPGAALANFRSGRYSQGFSTLTMQLSRLLFLTPEKTPERKIKEVILAFQIEKNFTKEEIFTLYCNQVYFGNGNYGVEAESQFLFGRSIKDLTLAEAALLAGLPQNPTRLSPVDYPERALQRRNHVLDRMAQEKYVTAQEAAAARQLPLGLHVRREPPSIAPHFLEEVRKYLEKEYGSQRIYQGGLRVYTTLDPVMQRAAVQALRKGLRTMDRRARGFVKPEATILKDAAFPDPIHLDEWDWPFAEGDVVRGVVLASDRTLALGAGWGEGRQGPARAGAEGGGGPARPGGEDGGGEGDGGRLRFRAEQVQPGHPGHAPGRLGLQADRLLGGGGEARLDPGHHRRGLAHLVPEPVEQDRVGAPELRPPVPGALPGPQGGGTEPEHPRGEDAPGSGDRVRDRVRAQARPGGRAAALPAHRFGCGRGHPHRDGRRLRHLRQPGPAHEALPDRAHHGPRRQHHRGGAAPGPGRHPGRHRVHPDQPAPGRGH